MGYKQTKADRNLNTIERKRGEVLRGHNQLPKGRIKHLISQIADLEMYAAGFKQPTIRRPRDRYLFDIAEMFRIDQEKKASQQIRIAG